MKHKFIYMCIVSQQDTRNSTVW